jgi:hypothetical protein
MKTNVQNNSATVIYTNGVQQETQSQLEMIEPIIEAMIEPIIFKC